MRVTTKRVETMGATCPPASPDWIGLIQNGFYEQYRDAEITDSGYVQVETDDGTAYYVALRVEGVEGTPVFSGTEPPTGQRGPGILDAADDDAEQLADIGTAFAPGSRFATRFQDPDGIARAEACFS